MCQNIEFPINMIEQSSGDLESFFEVQLENWTFLCPFSPWNFSLNFKWKVDEEVNNESQEKGGNDISKK